MYRSGSAMIMGTVLLITLIGAENPGRAAGDVLPLIPGPRSVERLPGKFQLRQGTALILPAGADARWRAPAALFVDKVEERFGIKLDLYGAERASIPEGAIITGGAVQECGLSVKLPKGDAPAEEGYKIHVGDVILVHAESAHGLHNALMTLLQLIDGNDSPPSIPSVSIVDHPRFKWRGMLLDSSRSFLPADVIKRYIDLLSELKLNRFHWHIVDDQGWRIESKVFPKLHQVGGIVHNMSDKKLEALAEVKFDEKGRRVSSPRHSSTEEAKNSRGYYTQEELHDIVAYAAERHVMIVPEIDVPGHSTEMIAAYPELQCSGEPVEVARVGVLVRNAICPGKEEVYEFLDKLFEELATIFPSPYMHIGSDEVWTKKWMDAPENQWLIEKYGYTDNDGLQSYFVERVHEILKKHGKTMIAWDEVTDYAPEGSMVQAWRLHKFAREAAEKELDSVISPVSHCYIDYPQLQFTLKNLYHFEPIPKDLSADLHHHILGGEVNLWGERVTLANIDKKAFPRVIAHSEVMWTPAEKRDWDCFTSRLKILKKDWKSRGVGFGITWRDVAGLL
jgi:hexosaminidase